MSQYTGKVAWFSNAKGYGFLTYEGGPDVFVHYSALNVGGYKTADEGDEVAFEIIEGESGRKQATNVTLIGKQKLAP